MLNLTGVKAENLLDRFSLTPYSSAPLPPRGSAAKQYGEVSEWLKEHAWKVCIRQRIEGSNPSLTATFEKELVRKYGLFSFICPRKRGVRILDQGSTTGCSQLDRLRAQRTGCP